MKTSIQHPTQKHTKSESLIQIVILLLTAFRGLTGVCLILTVTTCTLLNNYIFFSNVGQHIQFPQSMQLVKQSSMSNELKDYF